MLPLTQHAFDELLSLQAHLQTLNIDSEINDSWSLIWGATTYTSRKMYKLAFQSVSAHPIYSWMWKAKCTNRIKFFAWLILVDRLNTRSMLRSRNQDIDHHLHVRVALVRSQHNQVFFMDVILIAALEIWRMRNRRIFYNENFSVNR